MELAQRPPRSPCPGPGGGTGRFYSAYVVDTDGDGIYEIEESENDWFPSCAGGAGTVYVHRWNGSDYVEDPKGVDDSIPLHVGSEGERVRRVQSALLNLGFDVGSAGVDGVFGSSTAAAVHRWQLETERSDTGEVGYDDYSAVMDDGYVESWYGLGPGREATRCVDDQLH